MGAAMVRKLRDERGRPRIAVHDIICGLIDAFENRALPERMARKSPRSPPVYFFYDLRQQSTAGVVKLRSVAPHDRFRLAALGELLQHVSAGDAQQTVSCDGVAYIGAKQRLFNQLAHAADNVVRRDFTVFRQIDCDF
jgi:hypothetical protein